MPTRAVEAPIGQDAIAARPQRANSLPFRARSSFHAMQQMPMKVADKPNTFYAATSEPPRELPVQAAHIKRLLATRASAADFATSRPAHFADISRLVI